MSGGSFDYAYVKVQMFAEDLNNKLAEVAYADNEMVRKFLEVIQLAGQEYALMMKETEWLFSGNTSEETFLARVHSISERGCESLEKLDINQ